VSHGLDEGTDLFDVAFIDFPDPSNFSVGKLYTTTFYRRLLRRLSPDALFVVQSTSPLFARQAYWCVVETVRATGVQAWPYHVYVPSFGEWGFVLAGRGDWRAPERLPADLRFLTVAQVAPMFEFPQDMSAVPAEVNRLNNQALVQYYEREWSKVAR
jgi:spermidine synthase